MERFDDQYYVNGLVYVHLDAALDYARKNLPNVNKVSVYLNHGKCKVYMHERRPSKHYAKVSERMSPQQAWDLFVGHCGMLS
jgi:hypothetical protein